MIKFFRHIRQKLLSENKFSRYLLYAVGEILLVVIGILIALQINNWNEERKRNESEAKALKELLIEFKMNNQDLERVHRLKDKAKESLTAHLDVILDKRISADEKNSTFSGAIGRNTWDPQYSVLNGLFNSGMINNIKNDSLRSYLSYWQGHVNNYLRLQDDYVDLVIGYSEYINYKVPKYYKRLEENNIYNQEKIKKLSKEMVNSIPYQNRIIRLRASLQVQLRNIWDLNENYMEILTLLANEIEN